jgi:prepilin signal peptidase PulO-like enzyme (type II secretory pathway)
VLIALSFIDLDHQLLPDILVLPFLWLGLLLSLFGVFADCQASIIGATCGYLIGSPKPESYNTNLDVLISNTKNIVSVLEIFLYDVGL